MSEENPKSACNESAKADTISTAEYKLLVEQVIKRLQAQRRSLKAALKEQDSLIASLDALLKSK